MQNRVAKQDNLKLLQANQGANLEVDVSYHEWVRFFFFFLEDA
jgi:hypothetical protein